VVKRARKLAPIRKAHVRKGDVVAVIAGNDRGKQGEVIRVDLERGLVLVKGVNVRWKHLRKSQQSPQGGRVQRETPIHLSNVLLFDEKAADGKGAGVRVRHEIRDGRKVRVSAASGELVGIKTK